MLGEPLVETFGADCIVTGLSRHRPANASVDWVEADIGKPAELASALRSRRPDVIVHTAALTNVDECERHPDLAARINRDAVTEIADFCSGSGARLVHVSTDAVFDGTRVGRYTETDLAAPLNVYGRTKLEAEKVALQAQGLVLRTNIFGWRRGRADGLAEWILAGLRAGTTLTMFTDVFFTPIATQLLAPIIARCTRLEAHGLYHAGGSEAISKHEFSLRVAKAYGLSVTNVRAISVDDRPAAARRAKNMSLDSSKLERLLGTPLPGIDESIAAWKERERVEKESQ
jgi:dTDP-4-dehydrorhamnose reductase